MEVTSNKYNAFGLDSVERGRSLAGGEHRCVVWVWLEETVQALVVCSVFTLAKRTDVITAEGPTFQTQVQQVCLGDGQKDARTETLHQPPLLKPRHVGVQSTQHTQVVQ